MLNPWFQDWEALVPMFGNMLGNCLFQELGTHSSKIGKHWFEPLGASSSPNWEPVVPRLRCIGYNVWEPLVPRTRSMCFQDWEALVRTLANQQFLKLGTRVPMISNSWEYTTIYSRGSPGSVTNEDTSPGPVKTYLRGFGGAPGRI